MTAVGNKRQNVVWLATYFRPHPLPYIGADSTGAAGKCPVKRGTAGAKVSFCSCTILSRLQILSEIKWSWLPFHNNFVQ